MNFLKLFKSSKLVVKVNCPECGKPQPKVRKPTNFRQAMWGGFTCQNCGCEMDKFGEKMGALK